MNRKMRVLYAIAFVLLCGLFSAGCSQPEEGGRVVSDAKTDQSEVERIKNNPHMSEQAKAAALRGMAQSRNAAQQSQRMARE